MELGAARERREILMVAFREAQSRAQSCYATCSKGKENLGQNVAMFPDSASMSDPLVFPHRSDNNFAAKIRHGEPAVFIGPVGQEISDLSQKWPD